MQTFLSKMESDGSGDAAHEENSKYTLALNNSLLDAKITFKIYVYS